MNSKIGISIGCTNSCGIRKGRDSSALKVLVMGHGGNKEETEENDVRQKPTSIIHPSNCRRTILKNSVKPGWVEPDLNYIF